MTLSLKLASAAAGLAASAFLVKSKTEHQKDRLVYNEATSLAASNEVMSLTSASNEVGNSDSKDLADLLTSTRAASKPNEQSATQAAQSRLQRAKSAARALVWTKIHESGSPSMVLAVAVDGKVVHRCGEYWNFI